MSEPTPKNTKDFFISYAHEDQAWAEWLAWILDVEGYSVVLAAWNFGAGQNYVVELDKALTSARQTMVVVSSCFLKQDAKRAEWAHAFAKDPTGQDQCLLPVCIEACDPEGLLGNVIAVDLINRTEADAEKELLRQVRQQLRPSCKPIFPGKQSKPPFPTAHQPTAPASEISKDPKLATYESWLLRTYGQIRMVGVNQPDLEWALERLYVPLELQADRPVGMREGRWHEIAPQQNLQVEEVFSAIEADKHVVILGDAGTGKTTALKKLLYVALKKGPETLQLPAKTRVVFLRLAELPKFFRTDEPLSALFRDRLVKGRPELADTDLGEQIWTSKSLLLLLDGLDEIVKPEARTRAVDLIETAQNQRDGLRVVVSCRRSADTEILRSAQFRRFMVSYLETPQRYALAKNWFTLLFEQQLIENAEALAEREAQALMDRIGQVEKLDRHHWALISTPLFATLLCVLHLESNEELPKTGVLFLQRSLELLLDRDGLKRGAVLADPEEKPFELRTMLETLGTLSLRIQMEDRQDGLTWEEWTDWCKQVFPRLVRGGRLIPWYYGWVPLSVYARPWKIWLKAHLEALERKDRSLPAALMRWLFEDANVLANQGANVYAYSHRGFQEYLAAEALIAQGPPGLKVLAEHAHVKTWREPFMFAVRRLAPREAVPLIREVLQKMDDGPAPILTELLQETLAEDPDIPVEPFAEALSEARPATQLAVLKLLNNRIESETLVKAVGGFLKHSKDSQAQDQAVTFLERATEAQEARIRQLARACLLGAGRKIPNIEDRNPPFVELTTGIRFLWVPKGTFQMGTDDLLPYASPVHTVTVSGFWLAETPVTNSQFINFVKATKNAPSHWRDNKYNQPEQPVVGVDWHQATAFCDWLSKQSGHTVKLPTEAQWEFAARGTDGRVYPWGKEAPDENRAWYGQDWDKSAPKSVGQYPVGKGPFGHLDLAGNILEWCCDIWNEEGYKERHRSEVVDPEVEEGDVLWRPCRGGAFDDDPGVLRAAYREGRRAGRRGGDMGFRPCVIPPSTEGYDH